MKRWLVKLVVFLLLGAIVNVAVAWGCGYLAQLNPNTLAFAVAPTQYSDVGLWVKSSNAERMRGPGLDRVHLYQGLAYMPPSGWVVGVHGDTDPALVLPSWLPPAVMKGWGSDIWTAEERTYVAQGWPVATLWGQEAEAIRYAALTPRSATTGTNPQIERVVPFRPLWPGFAINTMFYAGVLWMVFALPFVMRRRRRINRGLCPACAYPVGSSPVCTECGQSLGN